jgi:hypothetical protein
LRTPPQCRGEHCSAPHNSGTAPLTLKQSPTCSREHLPCLDRHCCSLGTVPTCSWMAPPRHPVLRCKMFRTTCSAPRRLSSRDPSAWRHNTNANYVELAAAHRYSLSMAPHNSNANSVQVAAAHPFGSGCRWSSKAHRCVVLDDRLQVYWEEQRQQRWAVGDRVASILFWAVVPMSAVAV